MTAFLRFCFFHPTLGILGVVVSVSVGAYCLDGLRVQLMPDYSVHHATVTVDWPGVSARGVDERIGRHLDRSLNGVAGVREVHTTSRDESVFSYIELDRDSDAFVVLERVKEQIQNITNFPQGADPPVLTRIEPLENVGRLVVFGPMPATSRRSVAQYVAEKFRRNGVTRLSLLEMKPEPFVVDVDPTTASRAGIALDEISARIERELRGQSTLRVTRYSENSLSAIAQVTSPPHLGELPLGPEWNGLKLKDIAQIRKDENTQIPRYVFRDGIGFFVRLQRAPGEDLESVTKAVELTVEQLKAELPSSLTIQLFDMESHHIRDRIVLLGTSGGLGLLLVFGLLLPIVGLRASIWVCLGLLTTFFLSFCLMNLTNQSINLVSVFAMVLVIGVLVDDSIVVSESIASHDDPFEGVQRTLRPVATAAVTTMVAFFPMLFLTDEIGTYVSAIPAFVCVALLASLLECFVLLPNHMRHVNFKAIANNGSFRRNLGLTYNRFLSGPFRTIVMASISSAWMVVIVAATFICACAMLVATDLVGFRFWLNPQSNFVFAHVTLPFDEGRGTMESVFADIWTAADQTSLEFTDDGVGAVRTTFGVAGRYFGKQGVKGRTEVGSILIELRDQGGARISAEKFADAWRRYIKDQPEGIQVEIRERLQGLRGPSFSLSLHGTDLGKLETAGRRLVSLLKSLDGLYGIRADMFGSSQTVALNVAPAHDAFGMTVGDVSQRVQETLNGHYGNQWLQQGEEMRWKVNYSGEDTVMNLLDSISIDRSESGSVADMVEAEYAYNVRNIYRQNGEISLSISADHDEDVTSLDELQDILERTILPKLVADFGVKYKFDGHISKRDDTMRMVAIAFLVAVASIFIVLSLATKSFSVPFLIMMMLPFGGAGMVLGHLLFGFELTLLSVVALLGLFGVLVNDSILLVDEISRRRLEGRDTNEAIFEGYIFRLRAIFLTTATTVLGLIPLMLETSYQAQFLIPIAITVAFGMGVATIASVFVMPAIISILATQGIVRQNAAARAVNGRVAGAGPG